MGSFCYCVNANHLPISSHRDSVVVDNSVEHNNSSHNDNMVRNINSLNNTEKMENSSQNNNCNNSMSNKNCIPEIKSYFHKDSKFKLSSQRSKREASYDYLVKKLLEEKTKKQKIKRRETLRNPNKIRELVNEIKLEYEITIKKVNESTGNVYTNNDTYFSTKNTSLFALDDSKKIKQAQLSSHEIQFIKNNLCEKKLINDSAQLNDIINMFESHSFGQGQDLFKKGNKKQYLFIIESGCIEYMIDDVYNYLISGDCFSTDILEKNSEIECYAKTVEKTKFFSLYLNDEVKQFFTLQDFHLKIKDEKLKLLLQTPIFLNLELAKLDKIANKMKKYWLAPNNEIVDEKETIQSCYFLIRGCVQCLKSFQLQKKINPVALFCEISLFCSSDSDYCYVTETEAILYKLDYKDIKDILGQNYMKELINKLFVSTIKNSSQFNRFLGMKNFGGLSSMFKVNYYSNNALVSSSKHKKISLVICGRLLLSSTKEIVANPGDLFGELILQHNTEEVEIICEDSCIVFEANWYDILKSLKASCDSQISVHFLMKLLQKYDIFSELSEWKLFQIADSVKLRTFKDNQKIIKNGPQSEKMYIIRSGAVRASIGNFFLKDLTENESFGDITYENQNKNTKPQTFMSVGKTECYIIEKELYEEIIDFHVGKTLDKIFDARDVSFPLEDLYFIREIGAGSYGKVCLVHNKKNAYAAKTIEIKNCKHQKLLRYYVNEKNIMTGLNHPFIVKLVNTFKTNHHLYFLLEFIDGLTISSYCRLRNKELVRNLNEMIFLGACLFSVVNYLQSMRIIHRDIKPSNCIIDRSGYVKVIDFGVAKDMTGKDLTTTVLGTTHYISPEMILGNGYSFSTDYWSIGVMLYRFYFGYFPFGQGETEPSKIYEDITSSKLVLPSDKKHSEVNTFFMSILNKKPNKRLSSLRAVKNFELFKKIDFDELKLKKIPSPICIDLKKVDIDYTNTSLSLKTYVENELLIQGESDYFSSSKSNEFIADF